MTDVVTKKRLVVIPGNDQIGPWLDLSTDTLPRVKPVLDAHRFYYWEHGSSISVNNGPFMSSIGFSRKVDGADVQAALDAIE